MKIKHTFKGSIGFGLHDYGYYAYIDGETNELVIGDEWPHEGGEIFRGLMLNSVRQLLKGLEMKPLSFTTVSLSTTLKM